MVKNIGMRKMNSFAGINVLVGSLLIGCSTSSDDAQDNTESKKIKNIVVVISDDHSNETLGCYGNNHIKTPNMDRLASRGVLFNNAYSQAPLCSASRQSILSGKYPHATGVSLLFTPFADGGNTTIAEQLKKENYATALFGKTHFNNFIWWDLYKDGFPTYGFDTIIEKDEYKQFLNENPIPPIPDGIKTLGRGKEHFKNKQYLPTATYDSLANGTFLAKEAIQFIEQNKNRPFFAWVAFHEPHANFNFPIEFADMYNIDSMPLGTKGPEDERWVPEMFRGLSEKERKGIVASYYTSVSYMDKNLGLIMDALEENGLLENTLIVYTSDQGYQLNDHGRYEKHTMWKQSIEAPLIISGPGIQENVKTNALVELLDLAPTFTDVLGMEPYEDWQGKSFLPLLQGKTNQHRDEAFSVFLNDNKAMVATEDWKYIFHTGHHDLDLGYKTGHGPSGVYHKLYNLENDPEEMHNLAYKPAYLDTFKYFRDRLLDKFMQTHPDADRVPTELNKIGKLVWFCEPRDAGASYGKPLNVTIRDSLKIGLED
jgi:choline-sulfatase